MKNEELVWVEKEFAEKYNKMKSQASLNEERLKVFDEYINRISDSARKEFKSQLEGLEEDVAIYTGLMLKVKQAFEKAKNEQLDASYTLWENFEKELPNIKEKTEKFITELKPLTSTLSELNDLMSKINTYKMENVLEVITKLSSCYGTQKEMIDFLVKNFKKDS